jgi:flagellar protein FlgJ
MIAPTALWGAGTADFASKPHTPAEAARQFEALLLAHLLRTMREAGQSEEEKQQGISGGQTYLEIAEQQLAAALADRGGFGIARMLVRNLDRSTEVSASSADKAYQVR